MVSLKWFLILNMFQCSNSFSNNFVRSVFKVISSSQGVSWPNTKKTHPLKCLDECKYYDKTVEFPEYYLKDFHVYDGGNLNPVAAKELQSANEAIFMHHYKNKSGKEAGEYIRREFNKKTMQYIRKYSGKSRHVYDHQSMMSTFVVDLGCGNGVSTSFVGKILPQSFILGLDLSPYFLQETDDRDKIYYMHRDISDTRLMSNSVDLVSISYVLHELPLRETLNTLKEALRVLKPGGVLAVLDMSPNVRSSSRILKIIFDRTEPYLKHYKGFCMYKDHYLKHSGFRDIYRNDKMPKTSMFICRKPDS